jgi:hypothetical protein
LAGAVFFLTDFFTEVVLVFLFFLDIKCGFNKVAK